MAVATTDVVSGQLVTSTATEIQLNLVGPTEPNKQSIITHHVSGSVKFGVYRKDLDASMGADQAAITDAGDKGYFTVENDKYNLRCVGVGTFRIFF